MQELICAPLPHAGGLANLLQSISLSSFRHMHSLSVQVVYFPSCVTRMMGPARYDPFQATVHDKLFSIFAKAGYEVILPAGLETSCCGMMFNSRGFVPAAAKKMSELEERLLKASEVGKVPIVCDTSPCLMQIKTSLTSPALRFALYEPVGFITRFLQDKLEWSQVRNQQIACSCVHAALDMAVTLLCSRATRSSYPCGLHIAYTPGSEAAMPQLETNLNRQGVPQTCDCAIIQCNSSANPWLGFAVGHAFSYI